MLRFAGQPKVLLKSDRSVLLRLALLQSSSSAAYLVFRFAKYPLSHGSALWKQLRLSVFLYVCKPHRRYTASAAYSAGVRLQCQSHDIKCNNILFRASRRWSISVLNILHVIHSFPVRADISIIHFSVLFRFSAKL